MRKTKGFTLVELIIVMAIMTILMAAIMQMMKPIRSTYVDSTMYESQRNVERGIGQYVTESLRYANNVGIYDNTDVKTAQENFLEAVTGLKPSDYASATPEQQASYDKLKKKLQVITIDNVSNYVYNGETCHGRIVRKKTSANITSDDASITSGKARLALGEAYYGKLTYTMAVKPAVDAAGDPTGELTVTVSTATSSSVYGKDLVNVSTDSTVWLRNIADVKDNGQLDISKYSGVGSGSSGNVYIVFVQSEY